MGRPKKQPAPSPAPNDPPDEHDDEQTPAPAPVFELGEGSAGDDDKLAKMLDQFGPESGFRVYLERLEPVHSAGYLGTVPFDDALLENVRGRWGGGRYGGRVVDNRSKYLARVPAFRIAGPPREPGAEESTRAPATAQHVEPEQLATIVARAVADAVRAYAPPTVAPVDPLGQLQQLAGVLRELRPEPAPAVAVQSPTDMVTMFTAMLDLRDRLTEGAQSSGVGSAIREFAPLLKGVLAQHQEPGPEPEGDQVRPHRRPEPPTPAPPPAAAWLRPFLGYRAMLMHLADAGKDPSLYSDVLVDNISDAQAAAIVAADQVAGTLERDLFAAVPELNQSPERRMFAGALLQELRAGLYGHGGDEHAPPAVTTDPAAARPTKKKKQKPLPERLKVEATPRGGVRFTDVGNSGGGNGQG
jgi:hypothetical protein